VEVQHENQPSRMLQQAPALSQGYQ